MAADVRARTDKHGTIAFTLPISCQICLGKVKKPVLCPNNHVFCSPCMDVWLERNKQCPACRTDINTLKPLKQIIGGLNHIENDKDKMSNPDLRKARFDLLFKEYEDEFERLSSELNLFKAENEMLRNQLAKDGNRKVLGPRDKPSDATTMLTLTKKLQDAQKLYEKVKSDLSKVKEENSSLKDENINLNHENQKLRTEMSSRSPHRYGRTTVSTLETKVQSLEKDNGRLNKALEKSDKYIEELQKDADNYRGKDRNQSSAHKDYLASQEPYENPSKRKLFTEPVVNGESYRHALDDEYLKSYKTTKSNLKSSNGSINDRDYLSSYQSKSYSKVNGKSGKRVTFELPHDKNVTTSFDLEMPSPMKQNSSISVSSPVKGVLKKSPNDSLNLSKPSSIEDNRSYKSFSKDDSDIYVPKTKSYERSDDNLWKRSSNGHDESLNDSFALENPRKSYRTDKGFDDTQQIQRELDDLDISLTPDFTDCMKLLNRAEKKVHNLNDDSSMDLPSKTYQNTDNFVDDYKTKDLHDFKSRDSLLDDIGTYIPESTYSSKYYNSNGPSSSSDLYGPSSLPSYSGSYRTGSERTESPLPTDMKYTKDYPQHRSSLDSLNLKDNDIGSTYSSSINKKYPTSLRFGRSPSLDNLYMSKPAESLVSHTADDIPRDYKVRSSLPSYSSLRDDSHGKDYMSSLPPRPQSVRSRSYSDMGTTVSSLSRGKPGMSNIPSTYPVSSDGITTTSSALYNGDKPSLYTTSTHGPVKAHSTFAYTDVDLGVNPRNRASSDGLRTRSSSLDIPLTDLTKYSSTTSNPEYPVSFSGTQYTDSNTRYSSSSYIPSSTASLKPIQESAYSYISNSSSLGNGTDSYLPEPKKRLFDSSDDLEMSLSPIKATRKM
ncbi:uncharacterized protein LOC143042569 isoform X1 [Mytilus galloprovincialis]|uniref:dentin sialophosphoprotein-like isoform X1 n=1 Tax=Mytilus edulis TaxID=6550 RepID=UPI0039F0D6DC